MENFKMMQIVPIRDLKDTNRISALTKETRGPVFVTKNGYEDMVIMSMYEYKKTLWLNYVREALREGEEAIARGETRDGKTVMKELIARYEKKVRP